MASNFDSMNEGAAGSRKEAGAESESCGNQPALDWIGLQLVDHKDQPVGDVGYTITLPDSQERRGVLESSGGVRIEKIPSGQCQVAFGASQWEEDWVEIELVDEAGQPVIGEKYTVTLPDGREVKGSVDRAGRALVRDLADSGDCKVTFEAGEGGEDFIEIELTDEEDRPIPRERYALSLPDGRRLPGILDSSGKARIENIVGGTCQVAFLGPEASPVDLTIILKNFEENPVPNASYEAELSNGEKLSGKLDAEGRVFILNVPQGQLKLAFDILGTDEAGADGSAAAGSGADEAGADEAGANV
ncbi:MAG: hypothetical protein ACKVHE_17285 [Planctomycetales bacterium]